MHSIEIEARSREEERVEKERERRREGGVDREEKEIFSFLLKSF